MGSCPQAPDSLPSRRSRLALLLTLALALAAAAAEHLFYRFQMGDVAWNAVGVAAHFLLDTAMLWPLALVALAGSALLARRMALATGDREGLLGRAGVAALLFALLVMPTVGLRDAVHETIGLRFDLALAESPFPAVPGVDDALAGDASLCSYRGLKAAPPAEASRWRRALEAAAENGRRTLIVQVAFLPLLLLGLAFLYRVDLLRGLSPRRRRRALVRAARWALAGAAVLALMTAIPRTRADIVDTPYTLKAATDPCTTGGPFRDYDVSAITVEMTLNRFGNHDPAAFMYVLDQNIAAVASQEATGQVSAGLRKDPIQPLVLRATLGECVRINFTNQLADDASIHILGLPHTVSNAGGAVGDNPNTFAAPSQTITYEIPIPTDPGAERAYYFYDHGASRQRVAHGLFGVLVAEPAGATWLDPETGASLEGDSNWEAIIVDPGGVNFREFTIIYHEVGDESFTNIQKSHTAGGKLPQLDNASGIYRPGARALNYRSEPFLNRTDLQDDKSLGYSSYAFGDPATPMPRSYLGEPVKTRLVHGGSEMFHVHHLHGGGVRWRRNPDADPANDISGGLTKEPVQNVFSTHLDSQSIGPGTTYNLEHECGAGGCQQAAGDFLYHCHIGQHYIAGMWGFWRVFDSLQPGLAQVPTAPAPADGVSAWELLFANSGRTYDGKELVLTVNNPSTEQLLSEWVENQLPPQGVSIDDQDATVWDWTTGGSPTQPTYLGEPDDSTVWANWQSPIPGQRPEILFNLENGRYTWPLFRPHLGKRPPFSPNGHSGAPWLGEDGTTVRTDGLCPADALLNNPAVDRKTRGYPITAINVPIQVTDSGTDSNGKIYVLGEDKDDVLAGTKPRQPLAIRSNVQDCVDVILTNEIPDSADSSNFSKVNMHIHFVQFDPQASDGVVTGFSYEQSTRPYATENRTLTSAVSAGATAVAVSSTARLVDGVWIGVGLGEGICTPGGGGEPVACTEVRKITSIVGTTLNLDAPLDFAHAAGEAVGVEFVRYKWYSDVDTGTVFWHDHVNFMNWDHGLFGAHIVEPTGSTYHDPTTGVEVRSGTIVDIHAPSTASVGAGQQGSFREFMVFLHNASPVTGGPGDGGTINLRAEPWATRTGNAAYRFSSVTHNDPITPIPRAYVGDPFVIRGLGVVERVGGLRVAGHRFAQERFAGVPLTDTSHIGISERYDLVLENGAGGALGLPGDYLYYSTISRDFEAGAWGILRVHDTLQGDLQVLPDRTPPGGGAGFPDLVFTGGAPPESTAPGDPCPMGSTVVAYNVRISPSIIVYQDSPLIRDTAARVYSLDSGSNPAQVREPLVLRVNQGECLEVNLNNATGNRASFSVGELLADPQGSAGSAVGFNHDSTVAAGASRTYRLYADEEVGAALVMNFGDLGTLPRGGYGVVVVEPAGSTYHDPDTGAPIQSGVAAEIATPTGSFRELVAVIADEDNVIGQNVMPYPTAVAGLAGLSYSVEDLSDRGNDDSLVFSNSVNHDPRHVLTAPASTPVTLRVAQVWGGQPHVFSVEGHRFALDDGIADSELVSSRLLVPGMTYDADLVGGAGGGYDFEGDYLFFDNRDPFTEAGLWGLLRVGGAAPFCGNNVIEGTEECDGTDLGGATCADVGCSAGTVSCTPGCTLDYSACTSCAMCGNGVREGTEECDMLDFGGQTCGNFGCTGGSLTCLGDCTIDSSSCTGCGCLGLGEICVKNSDCCSNKCRRVGADKVCVP